MCPGVCPPPKKNITTYISKIIFENVPDLLCISIPEIGPHEFWDINISIDTHATIGGQVYDLQGLGLIKASNWHKSCAIKLDCADNSSQWVFYDGMVGNGYVTPISTTTNFNSIGFGVEMIFLTKRP